MGLNVNKDLGDTIYTCKNVNKRNCRRKRR